MRRNRRYAVLVENIVCETREMFPPILVCAIAETTVFKLQDPVYTAGDGRVYFAATTCLRDGFSTRTIVYAIHVFPDTAWKPHSRIERR